MLHSGSDLLVSVIKNEVVLAQPFSQARAKLPHAFSLSAFMQNGETYLSDLGCLVRYELVLLETLADVAKGNAQVAWRQGGRVQLRDL